MQIPEHQIATLHKQRRIIVSLCCLLIMLSSASFLLISCQSTATKAPYIYMVQSGDSISSIAKQADIAPSLLRSYNNIKEQQLNSGQILLIPGISRLRKGQKMQDLNIIHRNMWGASKAKKMAAAGSFTKITVHHTTESDTAHKRNDIHFLKSVQKYHQTNNKWADIAYHFLIGKDGKIYEGRLLHYRGAHVKNHNRENIGIAILGDLNKTPLGVARKQALEKLIEALREKYDIPEAALFAHSELGNTSCPGNHAMTFIKQFRN